MRYVMDFTPCPKIVFRDYTGDLPSRIPTAFFVLPGTDTSNEFIKMGSLYEAHRYVGNYTNVPLSEPGVPEPTSFVELHKAKPFNRDQMLEYARMILMTYFHELRTACNTYVMFVSVEDDVFNYDILAANAELSRRLGRMIDRCLPEYYLEWRRAHDAVWSKHLSPELYTQLTLQGVIDYLSKYDDRYVIEYGLGYPHPYSGNPEHVAFPVQAGVSIADMKKRAQDAIGTTIVSSSNGRQEIKADTPCWAVQTKGEIGEPLTIRHLRTFRIANFDDIPKHG